MSTIKLFSVFIFAILMVNNTAAQVDSLRNHINQCENRLKETKKTAEQIALLQQISADKETIIRILNDSITDKNRIILEKKDTISSKETELKVFRFFKITDNSVFNDSAADFSVKDIPLCLQPHWKLILDIHKLNQLLKKIDDTIIAEESTGAFQYMKSQPQQQQEYLKLKVNDDLENAQDLIIQIKAANQSGLSKEQLEFFDNLRAKYNNFLDKTGQ